MGHGVHGVSCDRSSLVLMKQLPGVRRRALRRSIAYSPDSYPEEGETCGGERDHGRLPLVYSEDEGTRSPWFRFEGICIPPYRAYVRIPVALIFNRLEGGGHVVSSVFQIYALLEGYRLVPLIFFRSQQSQWSPESLHSTFCFSRVEAYEGLLRSQLSRT